MVKVSESHSSKSSAIVQSLTFITFIVSKKTGRLKFLPLQTITQPASWPNTDHYYYHAPVLYLWQIHLTVSCFKLSSLFLSLSLRISSSSQPKKLVNLITDSYCQHYYRLIFFMWVPPPPHTHKSMTFKLQVQPHPDTHWQQILSIHHPHPQKFSSKPSYPVPNSTTDGSGELPVLVFIKNCTRRPNTVSLGLSWMQNHYSTIVKSLQLPIPKNYTASQSTS